MPAELIVLSFFQVRPLLRARKEGVANTAISLDLNRTTATVRLDDEGIKLPDGQRLTWPILEEIGADEGSCYHVIANEVHKIQFFSETFNRAYTLYPTEGAPTMLISGLPMHRIKGTDPWRDTLQKIKAAHPVGNVLDTATGLGYTAIAATKTAETVVTIELDPTVIEVCRLNPWSQPLFDNPQIERRLGDSFDEVEAMPDGVFSRVLHDPPTFSLAGHLYSQVFYEELFRVLTRRGRLFHYVGDLQSRSGAGVARGVRQRLKAAGFRRIVDRPRAFGIIAYK